MFPLFLGKSSDASSPGHPCLLVGKGYLTKEGTSRWTLYRLPVESPSGQSSVPAGPVTPDTTVGDSGHKPGQGPDTTVGDSGHKSTGTQDTKIKLSGELQKLAGEFSQKRRIPAEKMRAFILQLCQGQSLTAAQIGGVVCRNSERVRKSYLTPMVRSGALKTIYPERNSPEQAYIATPPFITRI